MDKLFSDADQKRLHEISETNHAQWPDLLVYRLEPRHVWFAEIKRPGEALRDEQATVQAEIERELGISTHEYRVRCASPE